MQNVQMKVIKGAMQALADGAATGALANLEVQPEQFALLTGDLAWKANERSIIVRSLDALMFGTMDVIGLPRFEIPAEYVAAAIAMFVHPVNMMQACRIMESGARNSAETLGAPVGSTQNTEPVTASQIYALVLQLKNDGQVSKCLRQFEERTTLKLIKTMEAPDETKRRTAEAQKK